jgi:DNA (cytosine-5)-methyltransferase 1
LADDRGNLALEFLRLAQRIRPRWLVWENVPGVLSSNGGRDFGSILGGLVELGYGFAYRVLDAQHFGVPQRRRRVFVVGYLGDWRRAAAVLFERHSLQGNPPPRRETGQVAPTIPSRSTGGGGLGTDFDCDGGVIAPTLNAAFGSKLGFDASEDGTGGDRPYGTTVDTCDSLIPVHAIQERAVSENPAAGPQGKGWSADTAFTLEARNKVQAVAFCQNTRDEVRLFGGDGATVGALAAAPGMKQTSYVAFSAKDYGADAIEDCSPTLRAGGFTGSHANGGVMPAVAYGFKAGQGAKAQGIGWQEECAPTLSGGESGTQRSPGLLQASTVRRLTPEECEKLQGFLPGYTQVPYRNKPAADGPRYKALGNSMAVPVMHFIGQRIQMVEDLCLSANPAK